jgi:alpha-1,4-digalacturonate transport system substrate-binding protein
MRTATPILVDDGFTAFVQQFVDWHEDGTIARDVWAGQGGQTYQDAAQEFINGDLVFYYSGSWQVGRMDEQVGDFFDWQVVGSPAVRLAHAPACRAAPALSASQTDRAP